MMNAMSSATPPDADEHLARVHAAFRGARGTWVWSPPDTEARLVPWLDEYQLLALTPGGDRLITRKIMRADSSGRWRTQSQLGVVDLRTRRSELLLDWYPQYGLGWSAAVDRSGSKVAFHAADVDDQDNVQLIVADLAEGTTRQLHRGPGNYSVGERLAWSPDGSRLAVDLLVANPYGFWDDVESVLVVDAANGDVVGHEPGFELLAAPGDGWTHDGLLVRSLLENRDAPCPIADARTVRVQDWGENLPFADGHDNGMRTLQLRPIDDEPGHEVMRWLAPDGTHDEVLCTIADTNIQSWLTIPEP